ncbi:hypothetical protein ARMGADRAFT_1091664 [Armillaria gallica]|uniref:Uncharacterized protein n=1 Tax=Armillaria gallica TaxID=47427 RepID=A0A2H3CP53_ARMGA|nr:hypothetical protein ARMGADRAFT_1091664 [Armillaria gallica]
MYLPYADHQYDGCVFLSFLISAFILIVKFAGDYWGVQRTATRHAPLTQSRPTLPQVLVLLERESLFIRLREQARAEDKLSSAGSANNGGIGKR